MKTAQQASQMMHSFGSRVMVVTVSELKKDGSPAFYHRVVRKDFRIAPLLKSKYGFRLRFYGKQNRYLGQIQCVPQVTESKTK